MTTTSAGGVYAGKTAQQRVEERRAALLDAATTIVAANGWRTVTIDRVAREAGLIRRYFYESFPDLDSLAEALVDNLVAGILSVAIQQDAVDLSIPELARRVVTALVDHVAEDPRRARVLFGELMASEAAARHREQGTRLLTKRFADEARSLNDVSHNDPIVDLGATTIVTGTSRILLDWVNGAIALTHDELVEALTRLWVTVSLGVIMSSR